MITTVQPASSAGASLMTTRLIGKFHGAISAHTPTRVPPDDGLAAAAAGRGERPHARDSGERGEVAEDPGRVRRGAARIRRPGAVLAGVGRATAPRPASPPRRRCAAGMRARSDGASSRPRAVSNARRAGRTARRRLGDPSGTEPHTSPVAGSVTEVAAVRRPRAPRAVDEDVVDVCVGQDQARAGVDGSRSTRQGNRRRRIAGLAGSSDHRPS